MQVMFCCKESIIGNDGCHIVQFPLMIILLCYLFNYLLYLFVMLCMF